MTGTIKGLWIIATNPLVSFPNRERAGAGAGQPRPAGGAGRLRDAHHRPGPRGAARPPSGARRTARTPTPSGGCPGCGRRSRRRARPGPTSTSSWPWPRRWGVRDDAVPRVDGPGGRVRGVAAGCRPGGCATTAASPGTASTPPAACSGRARPATTSRSAARPACTPTASSTDPDGRAQLCVRRARADRATPPPTEFPFLLNTGRTVEHWHTRTKTGRVAILERLAPEAWVEINPADAAPLGRRRRRPRARGRPAGAWSTASSSGSPPSCARARCSSRSTRTSAAPTASPSTSSTHLPREPNYKQCAVRIEPI